MLTNKCSLDNLQRQMQNFISKKSNSIPILEKSLEQPIEPDMIEELRNSLNPHLQRVRISDIDWLKFQVNGEYTIEISTDSGLEIHTSSIISTNYVTILQNRLYVITFTAPAGSFGDYLDLFDLTVQLLKS